MKVREILRYNQTFKAIIDNAKDVNSLVKFKLLGMCKQFEPIVTNFEIIQNEKISQYGTTDDKGNIGIFNPKKEDFENVSDYEEAVKEHAEVLKKFQSDIDNILDSESEVEIRKFKYTDIIDAGLPSEYLIAIYDLIEEWFGGIE